MASQQGGLAANEQCKAAAAALFEVIDVDKSGSVEAKEFMKCYEVLLAQGPAEGSRFEAQRFVSI